jgi:biopolymer transport protein ExbD
MTGGDQDVKSRRHNPEVEDHGIDLAPMLDFVLNLLIFFIITTSFVKRARRQRSIGSRARRPLPNTASRATS